MRMSSPHQNPESRLQPHSWPSSPQLYARIKAIKSWKVGQLDYVNCVNGISQNSNALPGNGGLPGLSLEETACILVVPDTLLNSAISSNSATPPTAMQSISGHQLSIVQRPNCLESLKTMPMLSVPAQIAKFSLILVNRILQTNNMDGDNDAQKKCDKYRVIGQCQVDNQPLYVNPKQYHRIMKRREARKKLTEGGRILIKRREYLHESRHKHALKRSRNLDGKFTANKK